MSKACVIWYSTAKTLKLRVIWNPWDIWHYLKTFLIITCTVEVTDTTKHPTKHQIAPPTKGDPTHSGNAA